MGFINSKLPDTLSYGSSGGPRFNTSIVETDSGREGRVSRWGDAGHCEYRIELRDKSRADIYAFIQHFRGMLGHAHSFPFKDHWDFSTGANGSGAPSNTDVEIGVGDGTKTQWQLFKLYTTGTQERQRPIRLPVSGTVVVAFDGVDQASGWSVNYSTGVITFTSAPGIGVVITVGFEFDVCVRYDLSGEHFDVSMAAWETGELTSISLVEDLQDVYVDDQFYHGGSYELSFSSNVSLSPANGFLQSLEATVTGRTAFLPDPAGYPLGKSLFVIANVGSNAFAIKDHLGGTLIASFAANQVVEVCLTEDGSGVRSFYLQ